LNDNTIITDSEHKQKPYIRYNYISRAEVVYMSEPDADHIYDSYCKILFFPNEKTKTYEDAVLLSSDN